MIAGTFSNLVDEVRATQDRAREHELRRPTDSEIRYFVESAARTIQTRRRRARTISLAGGLASAALVVLMVLWFQPDPLRFEVGTELAKGNESQWIRAAEKPIPVRFSDGTNFELLPGSRGRVASVTAKGANLNLETGAMRASVVPHERANWSIAAGPYVVHVIGTVFDVAWDPETENLDVQVKKGAVEITGPVLLGGQNVSTGQHLSVSVRGREARLTMVGQARKPAEPEQAAPEPVNADPVPAATAETPAELKKDEPPTVSWQMLAKQGQYKRVLAVVDRNGYDRTEQGLSALELLRLADVARMGGKPDRAMGTLRLVRQRFAGSKAASQAAYYLGVTEFDQRGRHADAAVWFNTYLREQPSGPLAREALGRLMESQLKLGRRDQAKATAERYLQAYPNGPHKHVANRLTAR